jgi:hypothetical protein
VPLTTLKHAPPAAPLEYRRSAGPLTSGPLWGLKAPPAPGNVSQAPNPPGTPKNLYSVQGEGSAMCTGPAPPYHCGLCNMFDPPAAITSGDRAGTARGPPPRWRRRGLGRSFATVAPRPQDHPCGEPECSGCCGSPRLGNRYRSRYRCRTHSNCRNSKSRRACWPLAVGIPAGAHQQQQPPRWGCCPVAGSVATYVSCSRGSLSRRSHQRVPKQAGAQVPIPRVETSEPGPP